MRLRSLLFVPGDRPDRFARAAATGADALILDLEDAVAPARKADARQAIAARLAAGGAGPAMLVRINPIDSDAFEADLAALAAAPPDAVMLPKAEGADSVRIALARMAQFGLPGVPLLPIATETPAAMFALGSYREVAGSLIGLSWGAEDLPAAIGAAASREADGRYTPPYEIARAFTLFAAAAAGVSPIDTVYPAIRDLDGLAAYAARAARDGFMGMLAIHPDQIAPINAAFTPSAEEVARARAIVDAFAAAPGAGALQLDGRMIDAPHLKQAERVLARAGER